MNLVMLPRFSRKHHEGDPTEYRETLEVDPIIERDYDAALVEYDLLTVEEFDALHPDAPFVPEADYERQQ